MNYSICHFSTAVIAEEQSLIVLTFLVYTLTPSLKHVNPVPCRIIFFLMLECIMGSQIIPMRKFIAKTLLFQAALHAI